MPSLNDIDIYEWRELCHCTWFNLLLCLIQYLVESLWCMVLLNRWLISTRHVLLWCVPTRHVPQIFRFRIESWNIPHYMIWLASMYGIFTHIWLIFYGKCRQIYHTWMVWDMSGIQRCNLSNQIWLIKLSSHWTSKHTVILYTIPVVILVYIPVHLCPAKLFHIGYVLHISSLGIPVRLYFWTCKVAAVADSWFIHWPMLVIYRCTYTNICIYRHIYICCFFYVQPNSCHDTGKRDLGWMFREEWVKAYNDFHQICHQLGSKMNQSWSTLGRSETLRIKLNRLETQELSLDSCNDYPRSCALGNAWKNMFKRNLHDLMRASGGNMI